MHGLIFETSVCYWQNQPGYYLQDFRLLAKKPASGTTPESASNLGYDYRYLPQILHATNRSLRGEFTEFFPTRLCLLRLKDTLHLSSVLRLTLDTRSLIHSDDGLNDAIRSRNDGRLCEEE